MQANRWAGSGPVAGNKFHLCVVSITRYVAAHFQAQPSCTGIGGDIGRPVAGMRINAKIVFDTMTESELAAHTNVR